MPNADKLLALADRLEEALRAADRLDGCQDKRRSRRRPRSFRHTVGVTDLELADARRLVDRSHLDIACVEPTVSIMPNKESTTATPQSETKSCPSKAESHDNDAANSGQVTPSAVYSISLDETSTERNAKETVQPHSSEIHRNSIQDSSTQQSNHIQPTSYQRPQQTSTNYYKPVDNHIINMTKQNDIYSQSPISAKEDNTTKSYYPPDEVKIINGSYEPLANRNTYNANSHQNIPNAKHVVLNRVTSNDTNRNEANLKPHKPKDEPLRRAPLYQPLPPGYNFAAPAAPEEISKPLNRFSSKKNRMKRANTIDIPKPLGAYRIDSDTDDDIPRHRETVVPAPTLPYLKPRTDHDRKFLAFMNKNEDEQVNQWSPCKAATQSPGNNWSNRFGDIKNAFEKCAEDRSRSNSSSSARKFWQANDEQVSQLTKASNYGPRLSRKSYNELQYLHRNVSDKSQVPWNSHGYNDDRVFKEVSAGTLPNPSENTALQYVEMLQSFAAKPIPVNQFSHAPMSAFKPPKKVISPVAAPPHIWSPPQTQFDKGLVKVSNSSNSNASVHVVSSPTSTPWMTYSQESPKILAFNKNDIRFDKSLKPNPTEPPQINKVACYKPNIPSHSPAAPAYQKSAPLNYPESNFPLYPQLGGPTDIQSSPHKNKQYGAMPDKALLRHSENFTTNSIGNQENLVAPQLVNNVSSIKQKYENNKNEDYPQHIDAQKLQIEFYEKQIREKNKQIPYANGLKEKIVSSKPQTYTVTDYSPPNVSTFVPLQQTPDIEKTQIHTVDSLPDVVINKHNRNVNKVYSPEYQKPDGLNTNNSPEKPRSTLYTNGSMKTKPLPYENDESTSGKYIEPMFDGSIDDQTEYTTVTKVMRGPVSQQATIKSGVRTRNGEQYRDNAARSLKGVLEKMSSPKHEVLDQIEKKRRERKGAPPHHQVSSIVDNPPVNMNRNAYDVPHVQAQPLPRPSNPPTIKYNTSPVSPSAVGIAPTNINVNNSFRTSKESLYSSESYESAGASPQGPSPLSKSESWHRMVSPGTPPTAASPGSPAMRGSPRTRTVARAKSMHLLSVPKLYEGGIARDTLTEKKKTVEAYFSGQLAKPGSQYKVQEVDAEPRRGRRAGANASTVRAGGYTLGRSRTLPAVTAAALQLQLLDESNADDAFEDLVGQALA